MLPARKYGLLSLLVCLTLTYPAIANGKTPPSPTTPVPPAPPALPAALASAASGPITINGSLKPGSTINVTAAVAGIVYVYVQPGAPKDGQTCSADALNFANRLPPFLNITPSAQNLPLPTPLAVGDAVCVYLVDPKSGSHGFASEKPTLVTADVPESDHKPSLVGLAMAGQAITVTAPIGSSVTVYLQPKSAKTAATVCDGNTKSFTADPQTFAPSLAATQELALKTPLSPNDQLCLASSSPAFPAPTFSDLITVAAAPDAGVASPVKEPIFAHSFYTVGAVISNQLSTSNSTTAAQYVDLGFSFRFKAEGEKHGPGITSNFSGRFTSIPVAAGGPAVTTPASIIKSSVGKNSISRAAGSGSSTSTPLNVLSSQESARVMGTASLPFRIGPTIDHDSLYFGPVAKASFSTLINPSQAVAPTTGSVLIAPQFAPTYNDWSIGGRSGWRRYPSDGSVQTLWQIDATVGKFSNLQDIFCNHKFPTKGVAPAPTNTSCYDTVTTTDGTTYTTYRTDRVSNARIELDGFARIPSTIFVIGIDANLSQYAYHKAFTDTMNRAGSDVRIYFGITGSISDLFKKLSLPAAP